MLQKQSWQLVVDSPRNAACIVTKQCAIHLTVACGMVCASLVISMLVGSPLLPYNTLLQVLYPAVCLKNAEMRLNFGDSPFRFGPPPGFVGIANAPADVTVSAAAAAAVAASSGGGSDQRRPLCLVLEPSR